MAPAVDDTWGRAVDVVGGPLDGRRSSERHLTSVEVGNARATRAVSVRRCDDVLASSGEIGQHPARRGGDFSDEYSAARLRE